jgi:hypothetical protein
MHNGVVKHEVAKTKAAPETEIITTKEVIKSEMKQ